MKHLAARSAGSILIATDSVSDAELIKGLLERDFDTVSTSTEPDQAVQDFERCAPQVLVLAFNLVEHSERYCLGLFRHGANIDAQSHRSILLCNASEVRRAYQLCQQRLFDDYNLFWPMTHDTQRLPMSVHLALRELAATAGARHDAAGLGAVVRRLAELETLLDQQFAQGGEHLRSAGRQVSMAEHEIALTLDRLCTRIAAAEPAGSPMADQRAGTVRKIARSAGDELGAPLRAAAQALAPLAQWASSFRQQLQPHVDSARLLTELAAPGAPIVLIVDDDELQRKFIGAILKDQAYRLVFAASAPEAFHLMRTVRPDLVLMDLMMPEMDGMAATRQIRSVPEFAVTPVIMITGNSGGSVVLDSLKSGATDFLVKPVERDKLIAKVAAALRGA